MGVIILITRWTIEVDSAFLYPCREDRSFLPPIPRSMPPTNKIGRPLLVLQGRTRRGLDAIIEVDMKTDSSQKNSSSKNSKLKAAKKKRKRSRKEGFMNGTRRKREELMKKEEERPRTIDEKSDDDEVAKDNNGIQQQDLESKLPKGEKSELKTYSGRYLEDNDIYIITDDSGRVTARKVDDSSPDTANQVTSSAVEKPLFTKQTEEEEDKSGLDSSKKKAFDLETNKPITLPKVKVLKEEVPKPITSSGFNVVLTHCTADFDSLASAVGLAKLWSSAHQESTNDSNSTAFQSASMIPTFVVLPRGSHPSVTKFLALHKHLFPIRSLRSLPKDLSNLHRVGLVDAQRRERIGPAEPLLHHADRVTIVDHHVEGDSDITEATDYIVEPVGSVSALVAEQLKKAGLELSEAEATLLALGIHADTGSLCFDSTTPRDAQALAWTMEQGASQAAIAEHAQSSLSVEQQGALTNALVNTNSTVVHGVTVSTVLLRYVHNASKTLKIFFESSKLCPYLSADGFINGLAAVTQDALELSSSDVFLLSVVYDAKSGGKSKGKNSHSGSNLRLQSKLFKPDDHEENEEPHPFVMNTEAWKGGERALKLQRLRVAFDKKDIDGSGYLEEDEIGLALAKSGVITSESSIKELMGKIDSDGDGRVDFDEFVSFCDNIEELQRIEKLNSDKSRSTSTMIVIGRVKAGINMKDVNLNRLFQQFGGGGHAKAASCTIRLDDESEAGSILQGLVDEIIEGSLMQQPSVGDFMTSPVLSAKPEMTEKQVEDLFTRYDVRALPVVDEHNDVIGLVTYKEVAAAKQRLWNKEQKRVRQEAEAASRKDKIREISEESKKSVVEQIQKRKLGSALKGWMKQHIQTVEASRTMAEVEAVLLENDVGCIPVVADGTNQLVGMVTRTDLLRQHRYYSSLHYHNKGFSDSSKFYTSTLLNAIPVVCT